MADTSGVAAQSVTLAYEAALGRDPTAGELALGISQVQSGVTTAQIEAYLATTGYAAAAIGAAYTAVVGRAVSAAELASDEAYLAGGGSFAALRTALAGSAEAARASAALYSPVVGRAATAGEITADQAVLANGVGTLASLRTALIGSAETAGQLQAAYMAILGRAASADTLAANEETLATGAATLAGIRLDLSQSSEATGRLAGVYGAELGRAITASEVSDDSYHFAYGGGSLASLRAYLATTLEAARDFLNGYQAAYGVAATTGALAAGEQALAAGATLQAAVTGAHTSAVSAVSTASAVGLLEQYQAVFGVPATVADLAASEQALVGGAPVLAAVASGPGAAAVISAQFQSLVGVAPSAAEVAAVVQGFGAGSDASLAGLQAAVLPVAKASAELGSAIDAAFETDFLRPATAAENATYHGQIAFGYGGGSYDSGYYVDPVTVQTLQREIAVAGLQALYPAEVGRTITTAETDADVAYLSQGHSFADLRALVAGTTEGLVALLGQYQATFRSGATVSDLAAAQAALAGGATLQAAVAAHHTGVGAVSNADASVLLQVFQAAFKGPESVAQLGQSEAALAGGVGFAAAAVGNSYGTALIGAQYQLLLGVTPTAAEVASVGEAFNVTVGPSFFDSAYGLETAVEQVAAASPEFAADINGAFQAVLGRPANAVELAAYRSELNAGAQPGIGNPAGPSNQIAPTLGALEDQIAQLSLGASGNYHQLVSSIITPQTIAGVPGYVYGLFRNDALITPLATSPLTSMARVFDQAVYSFNAATDVLQVERAQAANFGAVSLVQNPYGGTNVNIAGGVSISLGGVHPGDLTAANFRFV